MAEKYYDILDQEIQEASAGGMVCQIGIFPAFEVYCSLPPADRVFVYTNAAEKAVARTKAQMLAKETGKKAQETVTVVMYKDSVLGRDVSHWKSDLYRGAGVKFGPDAKTLNKKRIELGIKTGIRTWVRMGSIVSPNAEANQDEDWAWEADTRDEAEEGAKQLKRLHLPLEVYANKEAATEAAESSEDYVDTSNVPQVWLNNNGTAEAWNSVVPDIEAAFAAAKGMPPTPTIIKLANEYGVEPPDIAKVVGVDPATINFTSRTVG
jgi:hypothetical protein